MSVTYNPRGIDPMTKRSSPGGGSLTGTPTSMSSSPDISLVTIRTSGEPAGTAPRAPIHVTTSSVRPSTTSKPSIVTAVTIATYGWASRVVIDGSSNIGAPLASRVISTPTPSETRPTSCRTGSVLSPVAQ